MQGASLADLACRVLPRTSVERLIEVAAEPNTAAFTGWASSSPSPHGNRSSARSAPGRSGNRDDSMVEAAGDHHRQQAEIFALQILGETFPLRRRHQCFVPLRQESACGLCRPDHRLEPRRGKTGPRHLQVYAQDVHPVTAVGPPKGLSIMTPSLPAPDRPRPPYAAQPMPERRSPLSATRRGADGIRGRRPNSAMTSARPRPSAGGIATAYSRDLRDDAHILRLCVVFRQACQSVWPRHTGGLLPGTPGARSPGERTGLHGERAGVASATGYRRR